MATYYADDTTRRVIVHDVTGSEEVIDFAAGSVKTDNPLWVNALERAAGVSKTPPKDSKPKESEK